MAPPTRVAGARESPAGSRLPVAARSMQQPRRKTPTSQNQRPEESWEMLRAPSTNGVSTQTQEDSRDEDAMDIDDLPVSLRRTNDALSPLRALAERVGREVELFAEKLDAWKPTTDANADVKVKAVGRLVSEYISIAEATVTRLTAVHGDEQQSAFKDVWKNSGKPSKLDEENEDLTRLGTTLDDLEEWQAELHTWQLLHQLLECRHPTQDTPSAEEHARTLASSNSNDRFSGDGDVWVGFLSKNRSARDKLTILRWLESIAPLDEISGGDLEMIEEQLESKTAKGKSLFASGWSDTKERLKSEKRLRLWDTPIDSVHVLPEIKNTEGSDLIITQLDIDAKTRQHREVETADRELEEMFFEICWTMLRRGKSMTELREWCTERNEFARAFSMGACASADTHPHVRLCWRRACRQLARMGGKYAASAERGVYAILGGDRTVAEKVCHNWDDFLYANMNSLLLGQYETYVLQHYASGIPQAKQQAIHDSISNPAEQDAATTCRAVMSSMAKQQASKLTQSQPFKVIQSNIITDQIKDLLIDQGIVLAQHAPQLDVASFAELIDGKVADLEDEEVEIDAIYDSTNSLRVLTHLFIIYQDLGMSFDGDQELLTAAENVVCAYIGWLRLSGKIALIPLYASRLSEERKNNAMAKVISSIVNDKERAEAIHLMENSNIDVLQVLVKQYESALTYSRIGEDDDDKNFTSYELLRPHKPESEANMWPGKRILTYPYADKSLKDGEKLLVHSMAWFVLLENNWDLAFNALGHVARCFLAAGRVHAALDLYEQLPFLSISQTLSPSVLGKKVNIMDEDAAAPDTASDTAHNLRKSSRRRMSIKAERTPQTSPGWKIKQDALRKSARLYYELGQLVDVLDLLWKWRDSEDDYVSARQYNAKVSQSKAEAQATLDDLNAAMVSLLQPGFLMHYPPAETTDDDQMKKIRHAYLPEIVLAYVASLHAAGHLLTRENLLKCLDVATEIAANEGLVQCFKETGRMKELVQFFALTSKAMLELGQSNASSRKTKNRSGRSLGIWEVHV